MRRGRDGRAGTPLCLCRDLECKLVVVYACLCSEPPPFLHHEKLQQILR